MLEKKSFKRLLVLNAVTLMFFLGGVSGLSSVASAADCGKVAMEAEGADDAHKTCGKSASKEYTECMTKDNDDDICGPICDGYLEQCLKSEEGEKESKKKKSSASPSAKTKKKSKK